jgi:hypothetical protein
VEPNEELEDRHSSDALDDIRSTSGRLAAPPGKPGIGDETLSGPLVDFHHKPWDLPHRPG